MESTLITYGGMSMECDWGCGDPNYDGDANDIQYLFYNWLAKPLHIESLLSWEYEYIEQFSLFKWQERRLFDPILQAYFNDHDGDFCTHGVNV